MKKQHRGCLCGIGVGPGDPELMTLKALRKIREADVIALPGKEAKETLAYRIAAPVCPELKDKKLLALDLPMTKGPGVLRRAHRKAAAEIRLHLDAGEDAVFLTLGDPTLYSTYLYLHRELKRDGYRTEIVSGVPSFCAAAAALGIGLTEGDEMLHILPGSVDPAFLEQTDGSFVLMKAGRKLPEIIRNLDPSYEVLAVENCGMENQRLFDSREAISDACGYFTLSVIRKTKEEV
jgi:precorrin-2/cobalt-factor-2 C20-methyltransferase